MKIAKLENAETPATDESSATDGSSKNVLTTTQWLSIISIIVSLAGIYYKREEIKNVFTKKAAPPSPVLPRAPPPSPVSPRAPPPVNRKIRQMD